MSPQKILGDTGTQGIGLKATQAGTAEGREVMAVTHLMRWKGEQVCGMVQGLGDTGQRLKVVPTMHQSPWDFPFTYPGTLPTASIHINLIFTANE